MEDSPTQTPEAESTERSNQKRLRLLLLLLAVVVLVGGVFLLLRGKSSDTSVAPVAPEVVDFRSSLQQSVGGVDPKPLQDFFAEKVQEEAKDAEAKSAIYWITHRYFDNGGNIYEIYDFIEARPVIFFLKAAETTYPTIFENIRAGKVANYSSDSILALLAYYEVIDNNGYGDIALWGIAANKHAEAAHRSRQQHLRDPDEIVPDGEITPLRFSAMMTDRSMYYVGKIQAFLISHTQDTRSLNDLSKLEIIPDDLLVGLNQYGAALENLKSVDMIFPAPFTPAQIYEFNHDLASTTVPRLYFFTNYLYAASLVAGGDATEETVALPLGRMIEYAKNTSPADWSGSVSRVINAKTARESGMYSYDTVKALASLSEEFKNWLSQEGWTDADFN